MPVDKVLGYEYINDKNHPMANKSGKVYVHRLVASERLGRRLENWEHVHHIDGDKLNNLPSNLIVLSSSTHSRVEQALRGNKRELVKCKVCGEPTYNVNFCSQECNKLSLRKFNPTKNDLLKLVWELPTVKVAKMYGVSDKAVEKRCKLLGIEKPPRGYWAKKSRLFGEE